MYIAIKSNSLQVRNFAGLLSLPNSTGSVVSGSPSSPSAVVRRESNDVEDSP